MDPFFLPLPEVNPWASEDNLQAVQQLEQYLDVALCLLRNTAERLQTAIAPESLRPELSAFLAANDPIAQGMVVSRIDSLVKQKNEREAVRLIRELFGVTWDQTFHLYAYWSHWDHGRKLRCLQTVELRRLFASFIDSSRKRSANGNDRESPANRCESA